MLMPPLNISAQIVLSNIGAKNEALGSPNSIQAGEWSLWRNPAGLSSVDHTMIATNVRRAQAVNVLTKSLVIVTKTPLGSFGAGLSAFGDDIYNEQAASVGFANHLGLASLGIRADVNSSASMATTHVAPSAFRSAVSLKSPRGSLWG